MGFRRSFFIFGRSKLGFRRSTETFGKVNDEPQRVKIELGEDDG
jgi:hypothetical protein